LEFIRLLGAGEDAAAAAIGYDNYWSGMFGYNGLTEQFPL
jgi:hypothetical protein